VTSLLDYFSVQCNTCSMTKKFLAPVTWLTCSDPRLVGQPVVPRGVWTCHDCYFFDVR